MPFCDLKEEVHRGHSRNFLFGVSVVYLVAVGESTKSRIAPLIERSHKVLLSLFLEEIEVL